jgi:hypothetical protein
LWAGVADSGLHLVLIGGGISGTALLFTALLRPELSARPSMKPVFVPNRKIADGSLRAEWIL